MWLHHHFKTVTAASASGWEISFGRGLKDEKAHLILGNFARSQFKVNLRFHKQHFREPKSK